MLRYHIVGFVQIQITPYDLSSQQKIITATYLGMTTCVP
jgi:hypothetical protein